MKKNGLFRMVMFQTIAYFVKRERDVGSLMRYGIREKSTVIKMEISLFANILPM